MSLVGLSGAGKSTVAWLVAERLGCEARDLDELIVEEAGLSIPEIFEKHRESGFRRREADALHSVLTAHQGDLVLATGGGAPCQPGAMDKLLDAGPVVWLRAKPSELTRRLEAATDRPLLAADDAEKSLRQQLMQRERFYSRATLAVDVEGRSPEAVADWIADALKTDALTTHAPTAQAAS